MAQREERLFTFCNGYTHWRPVPQQLKIEFVLVDPESRVRGVLPCRLVYQLNCATC